MPEKKYPKCAILLMVGIVFLFINISWGAEKNKIEARAVAELYWNSMKSADADTLKSVSPHKINTETVFDWSYVNQSDINSEEGSILSIKSELEQIMLSKQRANELERGIDDRNSSNFFQNQRKRQLKIKELEFISKQADIIGNKFPQLGDLLKKAYWEIIMPENISQRLSFRLMQYDFIVNVKSGSSRGEILKRKITKLFRFISDEHDSGWKVLFTPNF